MMFAPYGETKPSGYIRLSEVAHYWRLANEMIDILAAGVVPGTQQPLSNTLRRAYGAKAKAYLQHVYGEQASTPSKRLQRFF